MKIRNVLIALAAVAVFSVSAVAQDTCDTAIAHNQVLDTCLMNSAQPTDPIGSCWSGYPDQPTGWYYFDVTEAQQVRITTVMACGGGDSSFAVYSGDCQNLVEVACSEDEALKGCSPWNGDICAELQPGHYYVQLTDWGGACGPYIISAVLGKFDQKIGQWCGDGDVNSPCEECEADSDCEKGFLCGADCKCFSGIPMLPAWGLVGLGLLLAAGGATVFGRRRK